MQVRDRLILAAERRFAEYGALDTTLSDIRADVGVSVGALYHHFPDKSQLYRQVWEHALGDYQEHFWNVVRDSDTAEQGVKDAVRLHLSWVATHPSRATVLAGSKPPGIASNAANLEFFRNTMRWWRTHAGYGAVKALDFNVVYALWLGPAQEFSRLWLGGELEQDPTDVAEVLAEAAWQAVKAQDTKETR